MLREGIAAPEDSGIGEILGAIPDVTPKFPAPQGIGGGEPANAFYSGAKWRPAPASNYTAGRSGNKVELLVVHTCAGSYSSCWGWLTTPYPDNPYHTSAHYVVNESGSEVLALEPIAFGSRIFPMVPSDVSRNSVLHRALSKTRLLGLLRVKKSLMFCPFPTCRITS